MLSTMMNNGEDLSCAAGSLCNRRAQQLALSCRLTIWQEPRHLAHLAERVQMRAQRKHLQAKRPYQQELQRAPRARNAPWTQHGQRHAGMWHAGPAGSNHCKQSMHARAVLRLFSGSNSDKSVLHERRSHYV